MGQDLPPKPRSLTYAEAGVDIDRADEAKAQVKKLARSTFNQQVVGDIGSFGGLRLLSAEEYFPTPVKKKFRIKGLADRLRWYSGSKDQ